MFSNLMQALNQFGGPPVQEGRAIQNPEEVGTEKPAVPDEDGVLTEEGFVSIGQSSFLFTTQSYPTTALSQPPATAGHSQLYANPPLPYQNHYGPLSYTVPTYQPHQQLHRQDSQGSGTVQGLPFVLHPKLRQQLSTLDSHRLHSFPLQQQHQQQLSEVPNRFFYDFDFERRVLRDINQQIRMSKHE